MLSAAVVIGALGLKRLRSICVKEKPASAVIISSNITQEKNCLKLLISLFFNKNKFCESLLKASQWDAFNEPHNIFFSGRNKENIAVFLSKKDTMSGALVERALLSSIVHHVQVLCY